MQTKLLRPIASASFALQGLCSSGTSFVVSRAFVLHNPNRSLLIRSSTAPTSAAVRYTTVAKMSTENFRTESDTFGDVSVDSTKYWGAQTQRSLKNFPIGGRESRMPIEIVKGRQGTYSSLRTAST